MTILQTKEVMQNLEKSPSGTPLTMKEVEILFSLSTNIIIYNFYKYARDHFQHISTHKKSQLRSGQDRFLHNWLFQKSLNTCKKEKECFASYASNTKCSRHTL